MKFNKFVIDTKWQQFEEVRIDFNKRLTILTGANGSGKTTILNILAKHFGWEYSSLGVPKKNKISKLGVGWFLYLIMTKLLTHFPSATLFILTTPRLVS